MLKHYPSIAALRADYIARDGGQGRLSRILDGSASWYDDETENDTLRLAAAGDTKLVPEAEAVLAKLNTEIAVPRRQWERAPAGAFCSVPDVLAGLPTPMRRLAHRQDERAPITILVTTTSSAGIEAAALRKRGTVILALVMALSRIRPVSLRQLTVLDGPRDGTGETVITAEINTTPLDLATACYVLTSAGFARRLTYGLAKCLNDFSGGWPRGYRLGSSSSYFTALVPRLGLEPKQTLVVASAELYDQLLTSPVDWVNAQVARFTAEQEDAA